MCSAQLWCEGKPHASSVTEAGPGAEGSLLGAASHWEERQATLCSRHAAQTLTPVWCQEAPQW